MRAVTVALEAPIDLNDVAAGDGYLFVRDGVGIAGRAVAARVDDHEAVAVLAAIEHRDEVGGRSPIAVGCIPFRPGDAATLVIPALLVGKAADGTQWVTRIYGGYDEPPELVGAQRPAPRAQRFTVEPIGSVEQYLAAVTAARDAVRRATLAKAVIAP